MRRQQTRSALEASSRKVFKSIVRRFFFLHQHAATSSRECEESEKTLSHWISNPTSVASANFKHSYKWWRRLVKMCVREWKKPRNILSCPMMSKEKFLLDSMARDVRAINKWILLKIVCAKNSRCSNRCLHQRRRRWLVRCVRRETERDHSIHFEDEVENEAEEEVARNAQNYEKKSRSDDEWKFIKKNFTVLCQQKNAMKREMLMTMKYWMKHRFSLHHQLHHLA